MTTGFTLAAMASLAACVTLAVVILDLVVGTLCQWAETWRRRRDVRREAEDYRDKELRRKGEPPLPPEADADDSLTLRFDVRRDGGDVVFVSRDDPEAKELRFQGGTWDGDTVTFDTAGMLTPEARRLSDAIHAAKATWRE